jgi:hypothetical protein
MTTDPVPSGLVGRLRQIEAADVFLLVVTGDGGPTSRLIVGRDEMKRALAEEFFGPMPHNHLSDNNLEEIVRRWQDFCDPDEWDGCDGKQIGWHENGEDYALSVYRVLDLGVFRISEDPMSETTTPEQLQWVLDHNMQIRAGHRVQIAEAVKAWQADKSRLADLTEQLAEIRALIDKQPPSPPIVAQEGVIPASDVNVWCAHCEHTYLQCPNCGKREWRLGDVPPLARYVREGVEIEQPETTNDLTRTGEPQKGVESPPSNPREPLP